MSDNKIWDIKVKRNPKAKWLTLGQLIEQADGTVKMHLDLIPTDWNGWAMCFERKEKE
jgi:hypothetical protein